MKLIMKYREFKKRIKCTKACLENELELQRLTNEVMKLELKQLEIEKEMLEKFIE